MTRVRAPQIARPDKLPRFRSEVERDDYFADLKAQQDALDRAWDSVPPGTKLRVSTARGIKSRRRAGLDFGQKPTTVEIVHATAAEIETRTKNGEAAADPAGGRAILDDDGLIVMTVGARVLEGGEVATDDGLATELAHRDRVIADSETRIAQLERELSRANTELAKRGGIAGENGGDAAKTETKVVAGGEPEKPTGKDATRRGAPDKG